MWRMSLEKACPALVSGTWERCSFRAWARGGLACAVAGREDHSVMGEAVAHNLLHGLPVSSNNTNEQVNRETKLQKARTARQRQDVHQDRGKVPGFLGPWIFHEETNIFRKWQHLLTFAKWLWWLPFPLSFCTKPRRGVREKQFSHWECKLLPPKWNVFSGFEITTCFWVLCLILILCAFFMGGLVKFT